VASVPTARRTLAEIASGGQRTAGKVTAAVNAGREMTRLSARRGFSALGGLDGMAPVLLADGVDGASDRGWTLTSRLPEAADLEPSDQSAWANQLGSALARIHSAPASHVAGLPSLFLRLQAGASLEALSGPAARQFRWRLVPAGPVPAL
jgi:hypothetical protein